MAGERVVSGEVGTLVDRAANEHVIRYLEERQPSCHGDTAEALLRSADGCGDWIAYSPSWASYRYVALVTKRRIFARWTSITRTFNCTC